jgi:hypothetical protein
MAELDLEHGTTREQRRRRSGGSVDGESKTATDKLDRELNSRLLEAFDQVVEWREARGDEELATAITEDKDKMSRGLVSLTHAVTPLRQPLLVFLGFVEPILAFGRVGRILGGRFIERRQRIMEERAAMQGMTPEEWAAAQAPAA